MRLKLETGALTLDDLQKKIAWAIFRPSVLTELDEMPHERGFDHPAAESYAASDRAAGFVKHCEVNDRKKARAALMKQTSKA